MMNNKRREEFLKRAKELGLDISKIANMDDLTKQQQMLEQLGLDQVDEINKFM